MGRQRVTSLSNRTTLVIPATTLVNLSTLAGNLCKLRGVFACADQTSCICDHCAQLLKVKRHKSYSLLTKFVRRKCSLVLGDPTFDVPGSVDILVGVDLFALAITGQRLPLGPDMFVFGFVLMGSCRVASHQDGLDESRIFLTVSKMDFHAPIQTFLLIEEPQGPPLSREEIYAEPHFGTTLKWDPSGNT
ncbi:hypothetical protein J437_LFUL003314 [Ladona fulva]|uniref:Uncharacterized protein n=1 Tax=Ladona fulva TaxID=123851 RepID=A0A8K0KM25_LADFU|nr:hypothetical protein J437_LFUL003314 [Ladona fulva]